MSKHAVLPEGFKRRTLHDLQVGEKAWAVSWAMGVDVSRRCWLNLHHGAHDHKGGTVEMLILRTPEGFVVGLPRGAEYDPDGSGRRRDQYAPVVHVYHLDEDRAGAS